MQKVQVKRMLEKQNIQNITKQNLKTSIKNIEQYMINLFPVKSKKSCSPMLKKMDKAKFALSIKKDMENQRKETYLER